MNKRWRLVLSVALISLFVPGRSDGAAAPAAAAPVKVVSVVRWLRVDPLHPRTLLVGGASGDATDATSGDSIGGTPWAMLSTDAGTTWRLVHLEAGGDETAAAEPPTMGPTGLLYRSYSYSQNGAPSGIQSGVVVSRDFGLTWDGLGDLHLGESDGYGSGLTAVLPSPARAEQLYGLYSRGPGDGGVIVSSPDGGQTWRAPRLDSNDPTENPLGAPGLLSGLECCDYVPDAARPETVYANPRDSPSGAAVAAVRSDDAGQHWSLVATPAATPSLTTWSVSTDPREGASLVGRTMDAGVPRDRIFLSADRGRTWRATSCDGDLGGDCPHFVVDNVFGAGASYAFVHDGLYRFHGHGPAEGRLPLLRGLGSPKTSELLDVAAGRHAGDPVYALTTAIHTTGPVLNLLYRSLDGGKSWQWTGAGVLPTGAPDARYFATSGHSLAGPFLAFWRRYGGLDTFGTPRTESLIDGGRLVQYTDRFLLQLDGGGRVSIAPLGRTLTAGRAFARIAPVASTPGRRYFPATGHSLAGRFLAYWDAHAGATLLGAPLSEVVTEGNGDGSGRRYPLQWFENGRLEYHPELAGTRYAIEGGLVGDQDLRRRGWLP